MEVFYKDIWSLIIDKLDRDEWYLLRQTCKKLYNLCDERRIFHQKNITIYITKLKYPIGHGEDIRCTKIYLKYPHHLRYSNLFIIPITLFDFQEKLRNRRDR